MRIPPHISLLDYFAAQLGSPVPRGQDMRFWARRVYDAAQALVDEKEARERMVAAARRIDEEVTQ